MNDSGSLLRFALVGVANTVFGYAVILFFRYGIGATPVASNAGGYAAGILLSYSLNRTYTFKSSQPHAQTIPRYVLVVLACFLANLAVLQFGMFIVGLPEPAAQACAVCAYACLFYVANRRIVFSR